MTLDLVLQRIDIALQEGRQADALAILEEAVAETRRDLRQQIVEAVERESFNPRGSTKRFVAVHNLKHELDRIFGEQPEP